MKGPGDVLKLRQGDTEGQRYGEKRSRGRILGEGIVQPLAPRFVEPDTRGNLVGRLEGRRQAGLQRPLVQNERGEGVKRADGGLVKVGDSLPRALALLFAPGRVFSGLDADRGAVRIVSGSPGASGADREAAGTEQLYRSLAESAPRAAHVRAKFYRVADGEEEWLDYPRILEILKQIGFNGWMSVVYEGFDAELSAAAVPKAVRYLRSLLRERNM